MNDIELHDSICNDHYDKVFLFGANLSGQHFGGAARHALIYHGAVYGAGEGHFGDSYALPTKDHRIQTLPLDEIKVHVDAFIQYARDNPHLVFEVTRIGCGLAGYTDKDIAPLFKDAPDNCELPNNWRSLSGR